MTARAFQRLGPLDIAFLIEARLELHQDRDLLAFLDRLQQRLHHGRVPSYAIQHHLNRQHVRIARRFAQKIDHRLEGLEGMMEQHVALANDGE